MHGAIRKKSIRLNYDHDHTDVDTWRIIPVRKCLVTTIYKSQKGHLEGENNPT